jgi:hypothetical protein
LNIGTEGYGDATSPHTPSLIAGGILQKDIVEKRPSSYVKTIPGKELA